MSAKLKEDMDFMEVITTMSEEVPGATAIVMYLVAGPKDLDDVVLLDSLDIRGQHLCKLNSECCGHDRNILRLTLAMFERGVFAREQIHANLARNHALPFVDGSIRLEDVSPYSEKIEPTHPKWDEWCSAQRASFERRFAE